MCLPTEEDGLWLWEEILWEDRRLCGVDLLTALVAASSSHCLCVECWRWWMVPCTTAVLTSSTWQRLVKRHCRNIPDKQVPSFFFFLTPLFLQQWDIRPYIPGFLHLKKSFLNYYFLTDLCKLSTPSVNKMCEITVPIHFYGNNYLLKYAHCHDI